VEKEKLAGPESSPPEQHVRLVRDLAELQLSQGQVGVVRNKWEQPVVAYEVEFQAQQPPLRVLLLEHYLMAA
jgi:Domain of unknown function (DUF4926)